jgi:undecaprenyl-diphosphatase
LNSGVATRDWLEDAVTLLAAVSVPVFAAVTVSLWFAARPYGPLRWKLATSSALTAAVIALLANQALAHLWERPRPFAAHADAVHLLASRTADPSFPSDHAAAAFAIAVAVLAFSRRAGGALLAVAVLIAVSRVALGVHYPADVLAGAAVGTASALLVVRPGAPWMTRIVVAVSRVSDPVVARVRRLLPAPLR